MATLASLNIALSADSAKLKRDLDRAGKQSKTWAAKQKATFNSVGKSMGGMRSALVGVAAALGVGKLLDNADALGKNAKAAGINVEAYQRLQHGFAQAGISAGGFSKGQKTLNKIFADAGDGMGTAVDALAMVGLSYEDLAAMKPEERMLAVARGLDKIEDAGIRSAVAAELMGKEMGTVKLDADQILKDGKGISVVTQEAADKAAVMNDAMNQLGTSLKNLTTNVLVPMVAQIVPVIDSIAQFAQDNPKMASVITGVTLAAGAFALLAPALTLLAPALTLVAGGIKAVGLALMMNPIGLIIAGTAVAIGALVVAVPALREGLVKIGNGMKGLEASADNVRIAIGDELAQWELLTGVMGNGTSMTSSAALAKLSEAEAHLRNAEALQSETEATLALQLAKLELQRIAAEEVLTSIAAPGTDLDQMSARKRDAYEETEQALASILVKQSRIRDITREGAADVAEARAETEALRDKIREAEGGMVEFGKVIPVEASERLVAVLDSVDFGSAIGGAKKLAKELGVSLNKAMQLMGLVGELTQSQTVGDPLDPRNPHYNSLANRIARTKAQMEDGSLYVSQSSESTSGSGGSISSDITEGTKSISQRVTESLMKELGLKLGEVKPYVDLASSFVDTLQSSFSTLLKTGDVKGFFTSVLDSFTSNIIDSFVEGLFAPLEESLTEAISGIFTNIGTDSGGKSGGFLSSIGSWIGGLFGAADGGIVPTTPFSKSYADSVPTMLQPGELVVPVDQVGNFMGGGSGGGQTFNINVTGDVSRLTRKEVVKMMPEIAAGTNMLNRENNVRR